ncbi:acyltransferase [bacterium]|nr:acyltransferase [bacterium]MDA7901641.1 acyltransferase [bacterium]
MNFSIAKLIRLPSYYFWHRCARVQFAIRGVKWPKHLTIKGPLGLSAIGRIELGDHITIVNDSKYNRAGINHPTQLVAGRDAILKIGNNVGMSGASIYAESSIEIGDHVLLGANARIYDTDFHPIHFQDRVAGAPAKTAAVVIGEHVWLAANVTILKGVHIGARSVIAAGSVVTSDIPEDCLAGGIPAKVIRKITENDLYNHPNSKLDNPN